MARSWGGGHVARTSGVAFPFVLERLSNTTVRHPVEIGLEKACRSVAQACVAMSQLRVTSKAVLQYVYESVLLIFPFHRS